MGVSVSLAILAGGASSRFEGVDKQELPFLGTMLGTYVARQVLTTGLPVTIVGKNAKPYEGLPVQLTCDLIPGFGPVSGLHAALTHSAADFVYLLACDMPYWSPDWFKNLTGLALSSPNLDAILALGEGGPQPFHALYSRRLIPLIESKLGEGPGTGAKLSCARAIEGSSCLFIPEIESMSYTGNGTIFKSVNTPRDARLLEQALQPRTV